MRVAVTGSTGRLGRALVAALGDAPFTGPRGPVAWTRNAFDLDAPAGIAAALDRDRPEVVVHTAAWTDVDGCARDPELAMARNGIATGVLATACANRGVELLVISTNEVFDGHRADGVGYGPTDTPSPASPYGASKLAGERAAQEAFGSTASAALGIARTSWLFGGPGRDFPLRILDAAASAAATGDPLRAVADEWGSPTSAADLAEAIVELLAENDLGGTHHLVNAGVASRAEFAAEILRVARVDVPLQLVPAATWSRDSTPPRWGVLAPTPMPSGVPMRPWQEALADQAVALRRAAAAAPAATATPPAATATPPAATATRPAASVSGGRD